MSRGQQQSVINTAKGQNATNFGNAETSFGDTQSDIGTYSKALNSWVSGNPYVSGGEYEHTINTGLANASDAGSDSLKGALQSQSLRTGQNSAADAATAASAASQNTRDLSANLANAQQQRIGAETSYNQTGLNASQFPVQAESSLYGTAGNQAEGALNTQAGASATPGFWDQVGSGLAKLPEEILTGKG